VTHLLLVSLLLLPAPARAGDFDGRRALRDLADLVRAGPGARVELIATRLRQAGFEARLDTPEPGLANVIGARAGASDALVIVATHHDARSAPAANEASSGPALLLELARTLAAEPLDASLWLVFFDGHEEGLRGSRGLAARLEREGALARVRALVVVERVGDTDLRLESSVLASPRLRAAALRAAPDLVEPIARAHFESDHLPFLRKGVREVLPLADLRFGPGDPPGAWTHTAADDLRHVSAASLARAGRLVRALVQAPRGPARPGTERIPMTTLPAPLGGLLLALSGLGLWWLAWRAARTGELSVRRRRAGAFRARRDESPAVFHFVQIGHVVVGGALLAYALLMLAGQVPPLPLR
jgi:hypothetical protein